MSGTELVSRREIADYLNVAIGTVRQWEKRDLGFPAPRAELAIGRVWVWDDVEVWARGTGRL